MCGLRYKKTMSGEIIRTPDFRHISRDFKDSVYEPAEDTFLLLDALEQDLTNIRSLRPTVVLEIGSGSGVIITALANALQNQAYCLSTDINENAVRATRQTAFRNGAIVETVAADLALCFTQRLKGQVDVLVFNPPYVVTPSEEVGISNLTASWAGGTKGRAVMDRLFPLVDKLLSQIGVFYLVIIEENDKIDIENIMLSHGFICQLLNSRRAGPERLSVLKFTRKKP